MHTKLYSLMSRQSSGLFIIFINGYLKFILFKQEVEHSIAELLRPVQIKTTAFRSRQSLRTSVVYKPPEKNGVQVPSVETSAGVGKHIHKHEIYGASSSSREEARESKDPLTSSL